MVLENKLQNIKDKLFYLLPQFKNICLAKFNALPNQIDKVVVGQNKLPLFTNGSIQNITSDDLKYTTKIKEYAFQNCYDLESVTIPDSVTNIGTCAFENCISLTSIDIPDGVTSIGHSAFFSCKSLTSIDIPDGVTAIDSWTFRNCSSLASVTIPDSVTDIYRLVFDGCLKLANMYLYSTTPPTLHYADAIPSVTTIHVPVSSGNVYKTATNWSSLANNIVEDIVI